ncbi:MAG: aldo/keto reductase [Clostridia bacterium]|nr:aldo/keto reductase [Clostridia bacterium]
MLTTELNTGARIPMAGLGVFRVPDKAQCEEAVFQAIGMGYRLIDTAAVYTNEDAVGAAVRRALDAGLCAREDLFITSKVWVTDMTDEDTARRAVDASIKKSGLEYFDLMLLHQAMGDYFAAWRGLEKAYADGKSRAIGVSNFYPATLANFCETVRVIPAVNQVELHPWYVQQGAVDNMRRYGVVPEAWAPLGGGRYALEDETLRRVAEAHGKTAAQVMLRWNIQRGVVVLPKSVHFDRIRENFDIWDFTLTDEEMASVAALDMGYSGTRFKHFDPDFVRRCLGRE